jgi:hypothetical protein
MRPKKPETTGSTDLFRARLDQIINLKHELVRKRCFQATCLRVGTVGQAHGNSSSIWLLG